MAWWEKNNLRLIQNNLRESDANLDVDALIGELKRLSTNVLMMNAGGIVAFYPTQLEYHYRAAGQEKDLLREAIDKAHANGMKFIARFDFSKAHESIYARKPEWFYKSKDGREVNYFGIYHTCINGYYQQQYSLQMIDEVISNYDVDGIFFNMFGYQNWDYSGNYYGTCFCDNCKTRFSEMFGLELPDKEDLNDPVYRTYKQFQDITTKQMLDNIHELVQSKNKDIAISTYNEHKVDIVRKESNTAIKRPHPVWLYSGSENVKSLEDSWDDKLVSNCCINAIDLFYRFTGVSKHEVNIRLKEGLASGSGLDFCIIGVFEDYPDRENLQTVQSIFKYHEENESYYGRFLSAADVALIKPGGPLHKNSKEYAGIFKMLKEQHILFDVIHQDNMTAKADSLQRYKAVIVPDIAAFSQEQLAVLEQAQQDGVHLLATGLSFTEAGANADFSGRLFGLNPESVDTKMRAAYLKTDDKTIFNRFPERDWVILDGTYQYAQFAGAAGNPLPLVSASTFGPPERALGHTVMGYAGAAIRENGRGKAVYMPWQPGELYHQFGYADHKHVLLDLLDHALEGQPYKVETNAPQNVELFFNRLDDETYILHLLNLSGFNGVTYFEPVPVYNISVTLNGLGEGFGQFTALTEDTECRIGSTDAGDTTIEIGELADFAAVLIKKGAVE
ncbi:alpha-amylase family protein [Paenibacillus thalictri]|uniref:Beta-galactosidase trimerisation domain-containing protein n=1 Tax=Paenibacillus thalictri TaxID=2527873 RepID=A0A4Q9DLA0_9BACL|nr:alpha-amylase family protein [Paenibacillus thalictri]TBL75153.1 hypothetical protein EYB31_24430 [Paenibacillus thalictri]